MSQVGESAKIHQDRRQQENPKQIHRDYICETHTDTVQRKDCREALRPCRRGNTETAGKAAQLHQSRGKEG